VNTDDRYGWKRWVGALLVLVSVAGCQSTSDGPLTPRPLKPSPPSLETWYEAAIFLGDGREWRPYPLIVDINRDGHLDIVATHRSPIHDNALHIWLGDGAKHFRALNPTWPSPGYAGLAAGDINRDGHLDLLAASHFNRFHTFLGDGAGHFTDTVVTTPDGYTASQLADLDGDGNPDAIVLGWQERGIEIYRGDGTGKWTLTARLMEGAIGRDLAIADINEDGKTDIVALAANRGVTIFLQTRMDAWSAHPANFFSATREFRSAAVGDINQDGHIDIALNGGFQGPLKQNGPDVYLGDGRGQWTAASTGLKVLQSPPSWGIALGDLNRDGHLDMVAGGNTTGQTGNTAHGLFLFTGDGRGQWNLQEQSGLPATGLVQPYGIRLGDLNHDDRLDIIVVHGATEDTGGYVAVWFHR
jgi:hypothetical protein